MQGRGGEGGGGRFAGGLYLHLFDGEAGVAAGFEQGEGLFFGFESGVELGFHLDGFSLRCGYGEGGYHAVGGFAAELLYLFLALDDEAHGDRLYAAGREGGFHLFPQHGRELEAHDAVEHAAGLLGVDAVDVDVAGVFDGVEYGAFGDFVEDDAPGLFGVEPEYLVEVPGDGFSFAVFIGSEPHHVGFGGFGFEGFDEVLLVGGDFVYGGEVVVYVDAEIFLFQVSDMAVTR